LVELDFYREATGVILADMGPAPEGTDPWTQGNKARWWLSFEIRGEPVKLTTFTNFDVGDHILDKNVGDQANVIDLFERRLGAAGYSAERVTTDLPRGVVAGWALSPAQ
jgi:hypothetical protein